MKNKKANRKRILTGVLALLMALLMVLPFIAQLFFR